MRSVPCGHQQGQFRAAARKAPVVAVNTATHKPLGTHAASDGVASYYIDGVSNRERRKI
jgi:hypothetical protein